MDHFGGFGGGVWHKFQSYFSEENDGPQTVELVYGQERRSTTQMCLQIAQLTNGIRSWNVP